MIEWLTAADPAWVLGGYGAVGLATALVMFGLTVNLRDDKTVLTVVAAACISLGCGVIWPLTWVLAVMFGIGYVFT